jgi:hypothetical protein
VIDKITPTKLLLLALITGHQRKSAAKKGFSISGFSGNQW